MKSSGPLSANAALCEPCCDCGAGVAVREEGVAAGLGVCVEDVAAGVAVLELEGVKVPDVVLKDGVELLMDGVELWEAALPRRRSNTLFTWSACPLMSLADRCS